MDLHAVLPILAGLGLCVWLVLVLPARMASRRGRSALAWLLISIFVSPFLAILLLLVLGNAPNTAPA